MKKMFLSMLLPLLLWSCGGETAPKSPLVEEAQTLMAKYPNFKSNDEALKLMEADIHSHAEQYVGKTAPFEGMEFKFSKVIENPQTGEKSALFESQSAYAEIDNPNAKGQYISATVQIAVLGRVSDEVAVSLDGNVSYRLSGIVHAYDEKDTFYVGDRLFGLFFGTFILKDLKVEKTEG